MSKAADAIVSSTYQRLLVLIQSNNMCLSSPVRWAPGCEKAEKSWDDQADIFAQSLVVGNLVCAVHGVEKRGAWGTDVGTPLRTGIVSGTAGISYRSGLKVTWIKDGVLADKTVVQLSEKRLVIAGTKPEVEVVRMMQPSEVRQSYMNAFVSPAPGVREDEFLHYLRACEGVSIGARVKEQCFAIAFDTKEAFLFVHRMGLFVASSVNVYGGNG